MIPTPHDRLFRATFARADCAAGLLRSALPDALADHLHLDALTVEPHSFVDDHLRGDESDLLYRVDLAGAEAYVYVLLEHQSTTDPMMPLRLLRYMVAIWRRWLDDHPGARTLPAVVPVVVHHSATGWRAGTRLADLYAVPDAARDAVLPHLPDFAFVLDDISGARDDALRGRAMADLATLVLWSLANARGAGDLLAQMVSVRDLVLDVVHAPSGVDALGRVWSYILEVTDESTDTIKQFIDVELGRDLRAAEALMTGAERLRQEGREEGRREGRREGRQVGMADLLTGMLEDRFGSLPPPTRARIAQASAESLTRWARRVVTAATVDDVFSD